MSRRVKRTYQFFPRVCLLCCLGSQGEERVFWTVVSASAGLERNINSSPLPLTGKCLMRWEAGAKILFFVVRISFSGGLLQLQFYSRFLPPFPVVSELFAASSSSSVPAKPSSFHSPLSLHPPYSPTISTPSPFLSFA